jgi:molecular chaperone GrpE
MFSSKKKNQGHESTAIQEAQSSDADATAVTDGQSAHAAAAVPADEPTVEPAAAEESAPPPDPLAAELAAVKDRYARLMADFDNFRKRQVREREEIVKRANEALSEDKDVVAALQRMEQLRHDAEALMQAGSSPTPAMEQELDQLLSKVQQSSLYQRFISANENFDKVMQQVNQWMLDGIKKGAASPIITLG